MKTKNIYFLSLLVLLSLLLAGLSNNKATANNLSVDFPSPFYLSANIADDSVELSWGTDGPEGSWLSYMTGNVAEAAGLAGTGTFRVAIRFTAGQLSEFVNYPVARISWFPNSIYTLYTLNIWTGVDAEQHIYSTPLWDYIPGQWNEFVFSLDHDLGPDIIIEEGTDYWFGLEMEQFLGSTTSIVFDAGPAVAGFGDMINLGSGWVTATNLGFNNNHALQVFIADMETGEEKAISAHLADSFSGEQFNELVRLPFEAGSTPSSQKDLPDLLGYNIFRNGVQLNNEPFTGSVFNDSNLDDDIYTYSLTALYADGESQPLTRIVQIGAPKLATDPRIINETLLGGASISKSINLVNLGSSALEWEIENLPLWISLSQVEGNINPLSSQEIEVTIDSGGLSNGTYFFAIEIQTNNFNKPISFFPVVIEVEEQSVLSWTIQELSFGNSPLFQNKLLPVGLVNIGTVPVYIFNFNPSLPNTFVYSPTWMIQPGDTLEIMVSFMADEAIEYNGIISVQYFDAFSNGILDLNYSANGMIMQPANLSANLDEDENLVTLSWLPPGASQNIIRYGSGENYSAIATSTALYEFAARFDASELMAYTDKQLDKVEFFILDNGADFTVNVYTDANADEPLFSLPVVPEPGQWSSVTLPEPIMLGTLDHLWLTYTVDQTGLKFIAGVDGGPAKSGKGDLFRINNMGWFTLTDFGVTKNLNIRGVVSDIDTGEDDAKILGSGMNGLKTAPNLLGYNVYRNDVQINTELITDLSFTDEADPAETTIYGVSAVFEYGESAPVTVSVSFPTTLSLPVGWEYNPTPFSHNIHIPEDVTHTGIQLETGDLIGAFYYDNGMEKSAGVGMWNGEHLVVTIFGNNPETEAKDGFEYDEYIQWKVFHQSTATTRILNATYDPQMPHHEGTFKMLGLSLINILESGAMSGETQAGSEPGIVVFPNPSTGRFNISGLSETDQIRIYDTAGRLISSFKSAGSLMALEVERKGVFIIEIRSGNGNLIREKLVIY